MSFPRPPGIISQKIRKPDVNDKDSAISNTLPFLPDLCSATALVALVLMGELLALVLVLALDGLREFNWQRLGLVSLLVQWVILPSAAVLCHLRPYLSRLSHKRAVGLSFTAVLAVLGAVMAIQRALRAHLLQAGFDWWGFAGDCLLGAICAGVVLRYAYLQQQLVNQQQAELGARIAALQSRIRPHFLFNSMNSLASLIAVDPDRAERLVEDLCTLFRASLAESRLVPLQQEVTLARRYLEIEALRLGGRLRQQWQLEAGLEGIQLPSLLLQPLLENAVLHGVAQLRKGGEITVQCRARDGALSITIVNPLPQETVRLCRESNGMAMENIRQRLAAYYGDRFRFTAGRENDHYRVVLQLPLLPRESAQRGTGVAMKSKRHTEVTQ
ncbi:sensor histidine kinase [Microbulbifer sp. 2205BS26-8]|uniref:sensor histidine kinase n=1 Tax=Microbulbifer sp. 2205BS26-8 TaxID=3064386 RepID=UPI00273F23B5|nr:histidine kinase [Microbulbifer sp. 2205BS26-8]MDP5209633.1 histidine kinase [Microbulbifer sp. 2205BS26-8]